MAEPTRRHREPPMHTYRISGLTVASALRLPGAIPVPDTDVTPDVTVRRAAVPAALDGAAVSGPTWAMADDLFLLRVPRVARFLIRGGLDIAVELEPGATDHDVAGFVLGTALGILLHQRGALVLHGSAVAHEGRAMAICGRSGAGKSTLAAALCQDGYAFAADDICVVGLNVRREPIVLPDGRHVKLWQQSIDNLELADRRGEAVRAAIEKYYLDPFERAAEPPRLSAIYVLREARPPLTEGIERLALPDAMRMLDFEAYRPGLRARIGSKPAMLAEAAAVFGHAQVFRLIRPRGFDHLPGTVAMLRAHWGAIGG